MSRKPTIKLSYPDASTLAMQLTDAMIRRAPGKRVLETTSEDKAGDGEGSLLDGLNSVRTSTGVEMTLTLEPNSMDYALEQLIRPNLTEEEKKSIFGEESTSADLLSKKEQAAIDSAADELANGLIMADQEKQIEIGKIPDRDLRTILADLIQKYKNALVDDPERLIEDTIKEIDHKAGVIDLDETVDAGFSYKTYALFGLILATIELLKKTKRDSPVNSLILYLELAKEHLEQNKNEIESYFLNALHIGWSRAYISPQKKENASGLVDQITERLYNEDRIKPAADLSWDDVEAEARKIGQDKPDDDRSGEIDSGLLNDLDDGSDGMAPAEEVIGHDE